MSQNDNVAGESRIQTGALLPQILKISLPTTVGMFFIALYSLADSLFVSTLGTVAGAAVGVAFSLHVLMQAVGYTLGMGGGSLLSRSLGKGEEPEASGYAAAALITALAIGGFICAAGLLSLDGLIRLLGASEEVLPSARAYAVPLLWSAIPMCGTFVTGQLLRAEGLAVRSMWALVCGSVCNVLLDPILIFRAGMGIAGASLATLISQCLSFAILLSAYLTGKSRLSLRQGFRLFTPRRIGKTFCAGLPSFFRQGLSGVATVLTTRAARLQGDAAVAALSIVTRLFLLAFSLCLGFGQGLLPIAGYHCGAGEMERAKKSYRISTLWASIGMLLLSVPLFCFAPRIMGFFRNDPTVIAIGGYALRAQCAVLFTHGAVTCTITFLQAIGKTVAATVLATARQGIFLLPLLLLLPRFASLHGLMLAQPIADGATFLFALPFARYANRSGKGKPKKERIHDTKHKKVPSRSNAVKKSP